MRNAARVGLVGSQFISSIHADAVARCPRAELVAVASPTGGHAEALARRFGIPHHFPDYRKMLEMDDLDLVVIGAPNDVHAEITVAAAQAGNTWCARSRCA